VVATAAGFQVSGRDDLNYISELQFRPYLVAAPDQLSWAALKALIDIIPDSVLALRTAGFLICLLPCLVLSSKRVDQSAIIYFAISISPLYWDLYFNQVRLALGVGLFLIILAYGRQLLAPLIGALGHTSVLLFLFPPAIIIAPFALSLVEMLDAESYAAIRLTAYRDLEYLFMPWYFGWELIVLALAFAYEKKGKQALGLVIYAIAVRLLADRLSVEIARRLLEIGVFIYSPLVSYLRTNVAPTHQMIALYILLGLLSLYAGIAGGVVSVGSL
jgi:hypothetical protein